MWGRISSIIHGVLLLTGIHRYLLLVGYSIQKLSHEILSKIRENLKGAKNQKTLIKFNLYILCFSSLAERIKAEAAEAANRELEDKQKKLELMMQQKEQSYQEHLKQLTEKMKEEQQRLRAEQDKIIALKLQVIHHIIPVHSCVPIKTS